MTSLREPSRLMRPSTVRHRARGGRWGVLQRWPSRCGVESARLVVLAPGSTPADRRLLRLWTEYWWSAAAVALVALVPLADVLRPAADLTALAVLYGAGGLAVAVATARVRRGARAIAVTTGPGMAMPSAEACATLEECAARLRRADVDLGAGRIDPVAHELVHQQAWSALDRRPR